MRRFVLTALLLPGLVQAQSLVRVAGVAFDSLSERPLPLAFVTLGSRSAMADSLGRFAFDSVAPGTYRVTMQHDALDSLGLPGIVSSIVVKDPMDPIRIATPSIRTMWRRVCPGEAPPDSGFVFGTVREAATREPLRKGAILGAWIDLRGGGTTGITQKEFRLESQTADDGTFVLCGLPLNAGVRLHAGRDSVVASTLDLVLTRVAPVRRQDLSLPDPRSKARGVVRGVVTSDGQGVSNARVNIPGVPEARSAVNGRFIVRDVPVGTQQIEIQGIGFAPLTRVVDVAANDTVEIAVSVERVVVLDSVTVSASIAWVRLANQFDERRRRGVGYYRDSTELGKYLSLEGAFATMTSVATERPRGEPLSIRIGGSRARGTRMTGGCQALIFIDRVRSDAEHLSALRPSDLAGIEVYRSGEMPSELATQFGLNPFTKPCSVVAWTKAGWR